MRQNLYETVVDTIVEYQTHAYRLAYSYVGNQEDALDAVQNAVCQALEHYESLNDQSAVKHWFYRIVINESLRILKERKRVLLPGEDGMTEGVYEEPGFVRDDDLYEQINRLEPDVQHIIKLRYFEDFSLKEIGQALEMNLNTVKAKLYRGLRTLRIRIEEVE